jgi:hypothetical protein
VKGLDHTAFLRGGKRQGKIPGLTGFSAAGKQETVTFSPREGEKENK